MTTKRTSFDRLLRPFVTIAASAGALLAMPPLHAQLPTGVCDPTGNRPPVAESDVATTYQTVPATIAVLANDTDPDGNSLTITSVTHAMTDERVLRQQAPFDHPQLLIPRGDEPTSIGVDSMIEIPEVGAGGGSELLRFLNLNPFIP